MGIAYGPNVGHGYTKLVAIKDGRRLDPIVFPSIIAQASGRVAGALSATQRVQVNGLHYWTGDDTALSLTPITNLTQDRLTDPAFIPALVAGAIGRLGLSSPGACVSCLPASWSKDATKARELGARLRDGAPGVFAAVQIIGEPLAMAYSAILDDHGRIVGDTALQSGRILAIDLGHRTDDLAALHKLRPIDGSYETLPTGTASALVQIRSLLSAAFEREFTLAEVDQAVRAGAVRVSGRDRPLPKGWDKPLIDLGKKTAKLLVETIGRGTQYDAILLGGGGAASAPKIAPILRDFPDAIVVPEPQIAIALGCARLAVYLAGAR